MRRVVVGAALLVTAGAGSALRAYAQAGVGVPTPGAWRVQVAPQIDLWFHGLAVIGYGIDAAVPLYDSAYAAAASGRSALVELRALRDTFAKDPAYPILHFVPLYFARSDAGTMLDAVEAVARAAPGSAPRVRDERAQLAAVALSAALPKAKQRRMLGEFVRALRRDWERGFRSAWDSALAGRKSELDSIQIVWDSTFAPRLRDLLFAGKLDEGVVYVSRPLGPEGRIFSGDRRNNVVAVRFAERPEAVAFAVVREMCFEWMRGVLADYVAPVERRGREQELEGYTAIHCGALVMERLLPERAADYREFYAELAGRGSLDEAYPIPESARRGLAARFDFLLGGI